MNKKIFDLAQKMNCGISRSKKFNTWTITHSTTSGLVQEVFTGDTKSFLEFLQTRFEICNNQ